MCLPRALVLFVSLFRGRFNAPNPPLIATVISAPSIASFKETLILLTLLTCRLMVYYVFALNSLKYFAGCGLEAFIFFYRRRDVARIFIVGGIKPTRAARPERPQLEVRRAESGSGV